MNTPISSDLEINNPKEILDHNKLNELQKRLEEFEVIDLEDYKIKSYCKNCSNEKSKCEEACKKCMKDNFKNKLNYSFFTGGWVVGSLISLFLVDNYSIISFGLASGNIVNFLYKNIK
jgi:hypothetical protein